MRALELDPSLAEAHTSLAFIKSFFDRDWQGAEQCYRTAIALNPGEPSFYLSLGISRERLHDAGRAAAAYSKYLELAGESADKTAVQRHIRALRP